MNRIKKYCGGLLLLLALVLLILPTTQGKYATTLNVGSVNVCVTVDTSATWNGDQPDGVTSLVIGDWNTYADTVGGSFTDSTNDVTVEQNGKIRSFTKDGVGYILAEEDNAVRFKADCSGLFSDIDTSQGKNYTEITFAHVDTSGVTNMEYMFLNCDYLTSLDLSGFDTRKVTTMRGMFSHCDKLKTLNISSFSTAGIGTLSGTGLYHDGQPGTIFMFSDLIHLESVTIGGNFKFYEDNDNTCLDAPSSAYIEGADGKWHTEDDLAYDRYELRAYHNGQGKTATYTVKPAPCQWNGDQPDGVTELVIGSYNTYAEAIGNVNFSAGTDVSDGKGTVMAFTAENAEGTKVGYILAKDSRAVTFPESSKSLFAKKKYTKITFGEIDTSGVTDMSMMFNQCEELTELVGLDEFDTSNVTTMQFMFFCCNKLSSIDVTSFNTEEVTDMGGMFKYCNAVTSLNVSGFDTKNVKYFDSMFDHCYALATLNGLDNENFDTSKAITMYCMFYGCKSLTTLDVSKFKTSNVTDMYAMFQGCELVETLNVSGFDTANVMQMAGMFENCRALKSVNLSNFKTEKLADATTNNSKHRAIYSMFHNCASLTALDLSSFTVTDQVTELQSMFEGCTSLKTLTMPGNMDTSKVTSMNTMFKNCSALTAVQVSGLNTESLKYMKELFYGCSSLTSLDLTGWSTTNVTKSYMGSVFAGCTKLAEVTLDANFQFKGTSASNRLPTPSSEFISGADGNWYLENGSIVTAEDCTDGTPAAVAAYHNSIGATTTYYAVKPVVCQWNGKQPDGVTELVIGSYNTYANAIGNVDFSTGTDVSNGERTVMAFTAKNAEGTQVGYILAQGSWPVKFPQDCYNLFKDKAYTNIVFGEIDTSSVINMVFMFLDCASLTELDLSHFDTSSATKMARMFDGCEALTNVKLSNFNTSKIDDMSFMFWNCKSLKELDLSSFNTSKVTTMQGLFNGCESLKKVNLSSFDTSHVTNMNSMFYNCMALTSLDLSKFNTSAATDMISMFGYCESLTDLNLSKFNTSAVEKMSSMFSGCESLKKLDLSSFDTSKVTAMRGLFSGCTALKSVNLSSFDTSSLSVDGVNTGLDYAFYNCDNLSTLTLGPKFQFCDVYYGLKQGPWYTGNETFNYASDLTDYQKTVTEITTYTTTPPAETTATDTIELPDGIIPGAPIAITAMPDVAVLNQTAADTAPEGYTLYGWQADSSVTVLTLLPEELESTLQALYDEEPEWPVTLTPLYQPVLEDEAEPETEPTEETTEPTEPMESTEPTEPTEPVETTDPTDSTESAEEQTEPEDETPIPTEQPALLPKEQDEDSTEPAEDTPQKTEPDPIPTSESATEPISVQETQASE